MSLRRLPKGRAVTSKVWSSLEMSLTVSDIFQFRSFLDTSTHKPLARKTEDEADSTAMDASVLNILAGRSLRFSF